MREEAIYARVASEGVGQLKPAALVPLGASLSAAPEFMLIEEDRTREQITRPKDMALLWREHEIFRKWRCQAPGSTPTVDDFSEVHAHGCHVAYAAYGRNILAPQ